jgi:hypothetical protein
VESHKLALLINKEPVMVVELLVIHVPEKSLASQVSQDRSWGNEQA